MREIMIWDDWMLYDDDGFCCGIRSDAPENVKKAYADFVSEQEEMKKNGCIPK